MRLGVYRKEFITHEVCLAAVRKYGRLLEAVPEALRTPELCRVAVQENGHALWYVPETLKESVVLPARAGLANSAEGIDLTHNYQ